MKHFTLTALTLAALAAPLTSNAATLFTFDPTGTAGSAGDITGLTSIDQAVGNALSLNGANVQAGGTSTVLYQANLSTIAKTGAPGGFGFINGTGNNYFTFVAGFTENVAGPIATAGLGTSNATRTASFSIDTTKPTFFYMYAQTALGNDAAGTGFGTGAGSKLILSGTISANNFVSNFTENTLSDGTRTATSSFDQFAGSANSAAFANTTTVVGSGTTSITANLTFADANYFPSFTATSLVLAMFNTTQKLPFSEVDPSLRFASTGTTSDTADNIGLRNGISGPNFQFQADANSSFSVTSVPEPGSLALAGLALGGLGFVTRRRSSTKA